MPTDVALALGVLFGVLLLSLLKAEKLVKITFGSYLLLVFSLAFGTAILQRASHLQLTPDVGLLGMKYRTFAEFLVNAQPTLMLVFYTLGLRFFAQNSHLSIRFSSEMFEKKLQTLLWCILSLGSILTSVYFSLAYFKGAIYDWLFMQPAILPYTPWIPTFGLLIAGVSLFASSQINLRFSIKKEVGPQI